MGNFINKAAACHNKLILDNDFQTKLENAETAKEAYELFSKKEIHKPLR